MKFQSKYSHKKEITSAQYILELVCENKAKADNKDLPEQFWKLKEWENYYKSQLRRCHKLIHDFGDMKLLAFVKEYKIWSLYAPWIYNALITYKYNKDEVRAEPQRSRENRNSVGSEYKKTSILDELDNE